MYPPGDVPILQRDTFSDTFVVSAEDTPILRSILPGDTFIDSIGVLEFVSVGVSGGVSSECIGYSLGIQRQSTANTTSGVST